MLYCDKDLNERRIFLKNNNYVFFGRVWTERSLYFKRFYVLNIITSINNQLYIIMIRD